MGEDLRGGQDAHRVVAPVEKIKVNTVTYVGGNNIWLGTQIMKLLKNTKVCDMTPCNMVEIH
jgi:hypothetical protein